MQRYGRGVMVLAGWMAVIGLFLCEPAGEVPQPYHLFNFMLRGLEIRLFQNPQTPDDFGFRMLAGEWLLYCTVIFAFGALLASIAYLLHSHDRTGGRPGT